MLTFFSKKVREIEDKMKFFKSKFFIITVSTVVAIVLITAVLSFAGLSGPVKLVLGTVAKPFMWVGSFASNGVNGFVEVFAEYDRLKAENEALKAENEELKQNAYDGAILKEENAWLKEYIGVSSEKGFSLADARVIARQNDGYKISLTLDKGSVHGVKAGMPVITAQGVYGQVVEAGLDWCRVESMIENGVSVGVRSARSGDTGVVEGDSALKAQGICRMNYISRDADLLVGDRIYTSGGIGSAYPSGLYVGEISEISYDEASGQMYATVTPAANLSDDGTVDRLMIITGYKG